MIVKSKYLSSISISLKIMHKKATAVGILSILFTLSTILMNASYSNEALAQQGTPGEVGSGNKSEPYFPPLNLSGPETAQELEGNNSAILSEDTSISNPNNTALSSTGTNEREACMELPGNKAEDCP